MPSRERITLSTGTNFVTVTATDAAGNATSVVRQITVDNTPPTLTLTGPGEGLVTKELVAHVTGTATANSAVLVKVNNVAVTLGAGGAFTSDVAITEGANTLTVVATNAAGLSATATRHVVRDTQAPALGWAAPADSAITKLGTIDVTGTITDATATTLTVNGAAVAVSATTKGYTTTLPLAADGVASITLVATDAAGNTTTQTRTVTRDATPPQVTVQEPDAGLVTQAATVHVSGSVSDLTKTTLTVNGVALTVATDGGFAGDVALTTGANTLAFVAVDAAGNRTQVDRALTRDNDAPVVTMASPSDQVLVRTTTVTVRGTITDASAVTATLNGVTLTIAADRSYQSTIALSEGVNTITLVATDAAGNATTTLRTVTLNTTPPVLTVSTPADNTTTSNAQTTVAGTATDQSALRVTVNGAAVTLTTGGAFTTSVALATGSNAIAVIATDSAGNSTTVTRSVMRTVSGGALPPDPATVAPALNRTTATTIGASTAFLYSGPSPIQTGVAPGTIQQYQASVVRGRVITRAGAPLSGVTVAIYRHPELGQTLSRADGAYDLAVNGGELLTLSFTKGGHLPVQRLRTVPRQRWVTEETIVMVPLDSVVTMVDLSTEAPVARGSVVTDVSGARQATAIFEQGTVATLQMPDGTTRPVATLAMRATEYTVGPNGPRAMPGALPASSAYTYAVELSVDEAIAAGATGVLFSKPVSVYVENFIGFPVGGIVPVASYDRVRAVWAPEANGRVVKVLSTAGGIAALDVDGSNTAADATTLAALGANDAELRRVATMYQAGQTLWRYRLSHFTPNDANWPYPNSPDDMVPKQQAPKTDDGDKAGGGGGDDQQPAKAPDCQSLQNGSIIGCERRTLGETIGVAGTPVTLAYTSERSAGYRVDYAFDVALSDGVPDSLLALMSKILLRVSVAGRTTIDSFPVQRGLHSRVSWDGRDAYGRLMQGQSRMFIQVAYVYSTSPYGAPVSGASTFGQASGTSLPPRTRAPDVLWQTLLDRPIGSWSNTAAGLGGWSINGHHSYDPTAGTLYLGTGEKRSAGNLNPTVVGTGNTTWNPAGIVANPDGSMLVVDDGAAPRIFRIARDGSQSVFAGNGSTTSSGDGGPATAAGIRAVQIVRGPDGSIYFVESGTRVRRIDPQGIITTIAGTGVCGDAGDDGPATTATFCQTTFRMQPIAVGPDGSIYVVSENIGRRGTRVRRIGPDGRITHFAGVLNGDCGYGSYFGNPCDENVPAINTPMSRTLRALAVMPDGSVLIGDSHNAVVWRVSPGGIRTRFAGVAQNMGDTGDGGPARLANLGSPALVAAAPDGSVYIATGNGRTIRKVSAAGIITRVVGTGGFCRAPACPAVLNMPALQIPFSQLSGLDVSPDNVLHFTEGQFRVAMRVTKPLPGFDGADIAVASEDGGELYRFDASGRHLATLDPMTGVTHVRFAYDTTGRLASLTDASGNTTSIIRAADGTVQEIVSPYGQRTQFALDAAGYLASTRAPGAETVQFAYDATGLMTSRTDAGGGVHAFVYDAAGLLVSDRNADGLVQTLAAASTATGKQVTVSKGSTETRTYLTESVATGGYRRVTTNAAGLATTTVVGAADTTTVQRPDGTAVTSVSVADSRFGMQSPSTRSTTRLPSGISRTTRDVRVVSLANPGDPLSLRTQTDTIVENGVASTTTFDAVARTLTARSAGGRTSVSVLDSLGRIVRTASGGLAATQSVYDARGRVQQTIDAGRVTAFTYDATGLLAAVTDPLGQVVRLTNDSLGRLVALNDAAGTAGFAYDSAGNLRSLTPAGRPAHTFTYTLGGLPSTYDAPAVSGVSNSTTRYRYDADLHLSSIIRPTGDSIAMTYDAAGRPVSITHADGTTSYAFSNVTGLLSSVSSSTGNSYAMTYDGALVKSSTLSGGVVSGTIAYGYDNFFRRTSIAVNGTAISLGYDADGLLTSTGALTLARSATNGLPSTASVDGVATIYAYDSTGVLASASTTANGNALYAYTLTRDGLDRIVRRVETVGGVTGDTRFAYDSAGRLSDVTRDGVPYASYLYDANGNRTRRTSSAGIETGVVDAQDRLTSYNGTTYRYTDAGELRLAITGSDTTTYHYDAMGALRWLTLQSGTRIDYVLDAMGRRIGKKVDGTLTQGFLYESDLRIAAELTSSGTVLSRFVYGAQVNVPEYMERGGVRYRIITDHLGSVRLVVDATTGAVQQRLDYDEYGRVIANSNPGFQPFGYAGGLEDDASGLLRFGARDYDARAGRFTNKDPQGFDGSDSNLYAYVANNPLNVTDPSGRCPWCVAAALGGLSDLAIQLAMNGFDPSCVNWLEVGSSAALAGVGVGLAAKLAKLGKLGTYSEAFGGPSRPTYRFLNLKKLLRVETHPIWSPDWLSYPHLHIDRWKEAGELGLKLSQKHLPIVEPLVGGAALIRSAQSSDCGC